ncbi:uncharacterized protein isoform X2 [Leptinotarsa decemlineata]
MHIRAPEAVKRGESVTLVCDYDLESAALYTIKWYRDDEEFYRFVPKESPPFQAFEVAHLCVDLSKSNSKEVTITNVERETSGIFKCEVTADAPLFHTDMQTARLIVADVPEDVPVLKLETPKVALGSKIRANCTTPGSYPAMNITWSLNDLDVPDFPDVHIHNSVIHFDALPGLETSQSTLSLKATRDLFKNGKLKLRCSASMFTLYTSSIQTEIQEDAPQLALIMVPSTAASEGVGISPRYVLSFLQMVVIFLLFQHKPG